MTSKKQFRVLMVDDDDDDWMLVSQAFADEEYPCEFKLELRRLCDGQEFLEYMDHCEQDGTLGAFPDLVLLDLNMPRMDGKEALKRVKSHPICRTIPIVVFTTSAEQTDVVECYQCGGASFIQKPQTYENLRAMVRTLCDYWICIAQVPDR
jgi:two-component system response regulator